MKKVPNPRNAKRPVMTKAHSLPLKERIFRQWHIFRAWWKRTFNFSLKNLKKDLLLRKSIEEAEKKFQEEGVRQFIVPTPEGQLRIINYNQFEELRARHYFPSKFKLQSLYTLSIYWTASCRNPKHGNSLPIQSVDIQRYYDWYDNTRTHIIDKYAACHV